MINFPLIILFLAVLTICFGSESQLATKACNDKHNQLSSDIKFLSNCKKENAAQLDVDDNDAGKHECYMMRWYCTRMCTKDGQCQVKSVFIRNPKADINGKFQTLDCICGYSQCNKMCSSAYGIGRSVVEEDFAHNCAATDEKVTKVATETTVETISESVDETMTSIKNEVTLVVTPAVTSVETDTSIETKDVSESTTENAVEVETSAENVVEVETSTENAVEVETSTENAVEVETSTENVVEVETSTENVVEVETSSELTDETSAEMTSSTTTLPTLDTDEAKCVNLDSGDEWKSRTKFIWNSCLITAQTVTSYEQTFINSICNQFPNGHLLILDTPEKETQFNITMVNDWGGQKAWAFWIQSSSNPNLFPVYSLANGPGHNAEYAVAVCQYDPIIFCVDSNRGCAKSGSPECKSPETAHIDQDGNNIAKSETVSGLTCQQWNSQTPHYKYEEYSIGEHNMCRNPDGEPEPWCYTTNPNVRHEVCYPSCGQGETSTKMPTTSTILDTVDETKCINLDSGNGWAGRTKFIWNSCLVSSLAGATYEEAKSACNHFKNGHLIILDTSEKGDQFNKILVIDWGAGTQGWSFWIQSASEPNQQHTTYTSGVGPGYDINGCGYICQYDVSQQGLVPWFQVFNSLRVDHFYTINAEYKDSLISSYGYMDEGIAVYMMDESAPCPDKVQVKGYYDVDGENNFYTINENETGEMSHDNDPSQWKTYCVKEKGECSATVPIQRYQLIPSTKKDDYYITGDIIDVEKYEFKETMCYGWPNATATQQQGLVPWYQTFSEERLDHFYTINPSYRNEVVSDVGYKDEGIAVYMMVESAPCPDKVQVKGYWNRDVGNNFYTINENETGEMSHDTSTQWKTYCVKEKGECSATVPIQRYQLIPSTKKDDYYITGDIIDVEKYEFKETMCYGWPNANS